MENFGRVEPIVAVPVLEAVMLSPLPHLRFLKISYRRREEVHAINYAGAEYPSLEL